ncbi:hypothetical protein M405DRAFT_161758 [Rhizopogon salebrosus TDB-379]|nr:hypothetical protein M405DRAFT_161758 [Rhizopogon salebrosus TDB-379]
MTTIFHGDSQIEVVTVLANCGHDIDRARQALTTYIVRKQEKGRSTDHILLKLRQLECKFINDTSLHTAFRDARALTCLPRSPDIPLPDFVLRDTAAKDGLLNPPALRDITIPAAPSPASRSVQLPSSPVRNSYTMGETRMRPQNQGSHDVREAPLTRASMPANPWRFATVSPYTHANSSSRSRSFTLPSSMPPTHPRSSKRLRSAPNSPAPTTPLPDVPSDPPADYDPHMSYLYLPPPDDRVSWDSQSSSSISSSSSGSSPCTPRSGLPPYPQSAAISRGDNHPPRTEDHRAAIRRGRRQSVGESDA